jgi:tripartite-type tricarboxylate transporter receptor subunit TctC
VPDTPFGIAGPKDLDRAIVVKLQEAFRRSLDDPAVQSMLAKVDMPAAFLGSDEYSKSVAEISRVQKAMIERLGLGLK